jgi:hypothetical protein
MNPGARILIIVLLIAFIAWRVWHRWQGAKEYVEADDNARKAWKEGFQALQQDERFLKLKAYAASQVHLTTDVPRDDAYQLVYATVMDEKGSSFALQDIDEGTFLILYVKGKKGKKQFALNLKDQSLSTNDLGMLAFQAVVPPWAG